MNEKLINRLVPFLGLGILIICLWALQKELKHYQLTEVIQSLQAISWYRLSLAILFTILGYIAFACYDLIAFRYFKYSLNTGKILFTAFLSHAISNIVGFATLSGGAIRYRFYSRWGVSARKVALIIGFENLCFWLGLFAVGGITFIIEPLTLPSLLKLPLISVHPIGFIFLGIVVTYLMICAVRKQPIIIKGQSFAIPSFTSSVTQIIVSFFDWAFAAGVLYILLPNNTLLSYSGFFGIYLLAMIVSIISHVSGGLGVFETVTLLLLPTSLNSARVLGSLLAFRAVYYIFPLIVAMGLLSSYEIRRRLRH
ncbi:lysylphosphatidylglycerol synthase domain-containing protein [Rivularia sp. UHCC 0363]|uniref:lysylphosphatidylglycerol synthase domain-containing protein n=1 Tax=Rivularia sp. UHCC 0363 TaxID=3110244 RepID=UPI002B21E045|nr:lysylphosphatidylglycerol synthase domain-containing protein [Rivularia sp. UHCC 0363]MEA5595976.1 lysylphosphatidylglycerol synthase domain-containing protein [Rivularia sp. UHCC 0363]